MEIETLEREFEKHKALHKYSVLKAMLIQYHSTIQQGQINLPDFMRDDTPEKLADRDLRELLAQPGGLKKFNRLYDMAWQIIAPLMD